jgi:undecaprenyl-diphosphatase
MPTTLQAALLGIVQGVTEFLPVSSSAHLILARAFFGFDADKFGLTFDVACHVGTLIAVMVYFRSEIGEMIASIPRLLSAPLAPVSGKGSPARAGHGYAAHEPAEAGPRAGRMERLSSETTAGKYGSATDGRGSAGEGRLDGARMIWLLVVGTIPAVIVGLLFNDLIENRMRTPTVAAVTLAVGATLFFVADRRGEKTRNEGSLTLAEAFWIGCAQAIALVPGVSRSGATITLALLFGLKRAEAARFIFLLSIPAILAAAAHEAPKVIRAGLGGGAGTLFAIGVVSSAIVGYIAIKYFIRYLANHSLDVFAWYRLALAASVIVWLSAASPR